MVGRRSEIICLSTVTVLLLVAFAALPRTKLYCASPSESVDTRVRPPTIIKAQTAAAAVDLVEAAPVVADGQPDAAAAQIQQLKADKEATYKRDIDARLTFLQQYKETLTPAGLWDLFAPLWKCHGPLERVGYFLDGGKWICDMDNLLKDPDCTVYSLGSFGDTSFEQAVMQRAPNCKVHTFDHTLWPQALEHVLSVEGLNFHPLGVTSKEQIAESREMPGFFGEPYTADNFTSILGSMEEYGIEWLDLLKIDIEGSEWPIFEELLRSNDTIPITQILIELHCCGTSSEGVQRVEFLERFFTGMWRHGYRSFANEPNLHSGDPRTWIEYSFIKIDEASGDVITRGSSRL